MTQPLSLQQTRTAANLVGIAAMVGSSAAFVANDTFVKQLSGALPLGEIITLRNVSAAALLVLYGFATGTLTAPAKSAYRAIGSRMIGDIGGTVFFLAGLMLMPIGEATALGQMTPLALTAAAAILYHEPVGWRRWLATVVGLIGVLMIVRPGTAAFTPAAFLIIASVAFVVMRDLATRRTAADVSTTVIAATSVGATIAAGLAMWPGETWVWPSAEQMLFAIASGLALAIGHLLVIKAMRTGDVATVGPFRYSLILFALISGWVFWRQWPDGVQMLGIAILTFAGAYAVHRERRIAAAPAV